MDAETDDQTDAKSLLAACNWFGQVRGTVAAAEAADAPAVPEAACKAGKCLKNNKPKKRRVHNMFSNKTYAVFNHHCAA